jgi:poly-gamma-glutamate synthesis protein (capsule biosynthesis protein)
MGANPFDPFLTMRDIRAAKKEADYLVVLYHGGKEQCEYPSPRLRNLCQEMVHNGANAVLTQHSHCIGCYEEYEGGHILYGQGNFHFVMENAKDIWRRAVAVEYDTKANTVRFVPTVANETGIELAHGEVRDEILAQLDDLSAALHDGRWKEGWHAFCMELKPKFVTRIGDVEGDDLLTRPNQIFAHYLDCEAHHDVICELFQTANLRNELD